MSIVKDLNDLHITLKTVVIGIIITMPFWYLDIYLFAPWFTKAYPIHIPIIVAFCLTIGWLLLGIMFMDTFHNIGKKGEVKSNQEITAGESEDLWSAAIAISTTLLGILSFFCYVANGKFFYLVLISFGLIILIMLLAKLELYIKKTQKKK